MLRSQNIRTSQTSFVSQIIFPVKDLLSIKTHAFLIGWNLENFRCCIACGIEIPKGKYDELNEIIEKCGEDMRSIFMSCSKSGTANPIILGEWIPNLGSDYSPDSSRRMGGIWITLTSSSTSPSSVKFHSLYSLGMSYNTSCYLFQYETVNTDRLNCLQVEEQVGKLNGIEEKLSTIMAKSELDLIVAQINCAYDLKKAIQLHSHPGSTNENDKNKFLSMSYVPSTVGSLMACIFAMGSSILMGPTWLWHAVLYKLNKLLKRKLTMFSMGSVFANWLGLRGNGSLEADASNANEKNASDNVSIGSALEGISLCDISLTAVYFSERITTFEACLRKCAVFPSAWSQPARLKQSLWMSVLSFVTMTWFDTLLGCIVGYYVYTNAGVLVNWSEQICHSTQQSFIIDTLEWFNHSPYGVKLNPVITRKVGTGLRKLVNTYHTVLADTKMMHYPVCKLVGCFGVLGFSAQLVVVVDVFRVITLHIAVIHRVLSFLHQLQIQLLYSLYLLFWGQKKNILRQRVDTCEYDKHQQLFGIVFFAIAIFCFPSFAAYYYLFAFAQLGVVMIQYVMWSTMIAIKEFPLYALHLFVWRPKMMNKGVQFNLIDPPTSSVVVDNSWRAMNSKDQSYDLKSTVFKDETVRSDGDIRNAKKRRETNPNLKGILKGVSHGEGGDDKHAAGSSRKMAMFDREQLGLDEIETESSGTKVHFRMEDGEESISHSVVDADHDGLSVSSGLSIVTPALDAMDEVDLADTSDAIVESSRVRTSRSVPGSELSFQRGGSQELSLPFRSDLPASFGLTKSSPVTSTDPRHLFSLVENVNNTVCMSLVPRRWTLFDIFAGYSMYLRYIVSEKDFAVRVLRGIFLGRPALDIQLIHATASLAYKKALKEQRDISEVFKRSVMPLKTTKRSSRSTSSGSTSSGDEYLGAYDCFNKNGARSTMKNRKSGGGRSSGGTQSSDDNGGDLTNPLDYINVYDLPNDGFPMKVSFWDTIRLAQSTIDEMDANEEEAVDGGHSGSIRSKVTKKVNTRQLSLSKLLLYLVLITATVNLVLTVCGGCFFLGSLLPVAWQMKMVSVYDQAGKFGYASSEIGFHPLRNASALSNHTVLLPTDGTPKVTAVPPVGTVTHP